jgi:hypothetical protein
VDHNAVSGVAAAVAGLTIIPRADLPRWAHLSLCVLDAVYSVGARYGGVARVCRAYAERAGLDPVTVAHRDIATVLGTAAEQPLEAFVADVHAVGVERFAGEVVRHRGRTSTRGGILKADAALRYAHTLLAHDVHHLGDLHRLFADADRFNQLEVRLRQVSGNGARDVRLGYLWMLTGQDDLVKPDRMVLRWLTRHSPTPVDPATARDLLAAVAQVVGCTPWELDHAIWRAESGRSPLPPVMEES